MVTDAAAGADAGTTPGGRVNVMPREASCRGCHTRPEQQRASSATRPRAPRTWRRENRALRFDHGPHVARLNGGCVRCHGYDLDGPSASRFEPQIPSMATCTDSCHARDMRELACSRCHTSLSRYTPEALSLVRHPPGCAAPRRGARRRAAVSQCHDRAMRALPHRRARAALAGVEPMRAWREFIHRGDFIARHGSEARLDQASCVRCHAVDTCDTATAGAGRRIGGAGERAPRGLARSVFAPRARACCTARPAPCVGCQRATRPHLRALSPGGRRRGQPPPAGLLRRPRPAAPRRLPRLPRGRPDPKEPPMRDNPDGGIDRRRPSSMGPSPQPRPVRAPWSRGLRCARSRHRARAAHDAVWWANATTSPRVRPGTRPRRPRGARGGRAGRTLRAFDARCTHLGCTVGFDRAAREIACGCHGGRFALDGRVLAGPPPSPLRALQVTLVGDDVLVEDV